MVFSFFKLKMSVTGLEQPHIYEITRHKQSKVYCIAVCSLKFILIDAGDDTQARF